MKALILVDIQNDFLPGGALAVKKGDEVVPVANRMQQSGAFDLVVATQDWHPKDHKSFAANHPGKKPGDVTELDGLEQVLWPVHCVQNTPGAGFAPGLSMGEVLRVFQKGTDSNIDSYSGFYDNGQRRSTGLGEWLRNRGVRDVYVMGLATDYCVKATVMDAKRLGFNVYLIEDGCRGVELTPGDTKLAIERIRDAGVRVVRSHQI